MPEARKDDTTSLEIQCLVCGKRLYTSAPYTKENCWGTCYDGIIFHSVGNFGSTVYDEDGGEYIEAVVCDECVKKRAKRIRRVFAPYERPKAAEYEEFDPSK